MIPDKTAIHECIDSIINGQVVVMPSDTVYGLIGKAENPNVFTKMQQLKGRHGKLGTFLAASVEQLIEFGFDSKQLTMAAKYWPGPVSVLLNAPSKLHYVTGIDKKVAVRIPKDAWLRDMLNQTGLLATTSANITNQPVVDDIDQAKAIFGDGVAYYLDGGNRAGMPASSVIELLPDGQIITYR